MTKNHSRAVTNDKPLMHTSANVVPRALIKITEPSLLVSLYLRFAMIFEV